MFRQTQQFSRGHLDQCKHLTALGNQCVVLRSCDPKRAPEPGAFHLIEPSVNHEPITELGCAAITNFSAHYYGIRLLLGHFCQGKTELLDKMCACDLDETQISDVRDDASAISIEEHHLH